MLRGSVRVMLIGLAVVFAAVQAIAINIGTSKPLPVILQRIADWPWWFTGLASLGLVALAVIDWRLAQRQSGKQPVATGGGDYAEHDIDKRQGAFVADSPIYGNVIGQQNVYYPPADAALTPQERRNRRAMLQEVGDFWVQGVLEHSLRRAVLIALDMRYQQDALADPRHLHLHRFGAPDQSLPPRGLSGTRRTGCIWGLKGEKMG